MREGVIDKKKKRLKFKLLSMDSFDIHLYIHMYS